MNALKPLVVAAICLTGCDGAGPGDLTADVTGTGDTDIEEPGAEVPGAEEPGASPDEADECPATLLVDEPDISAIRSLTSDATHLYYVLWPCDLDECPPDPHEVRAVPKAGGAPTILALEPGIHLRTTSPWPAATSTGSAPPTGRSCASRPTAATRPRSCTRVPQPGRFLAANADGVYWRSLDENEAVDRARAAAARGRRRRNGRHPAAERDVLAARRRAPVLPEQHLAVGFAPARGRPRHRGDADADGEPRVLPGRRVHAGRGRAAVGEQRPPAPRQERRRAGDDHRRARLRRRQQRRARALLQPRVPRTCARCR